MADVTLRKRRQLEKNLENNFRITRRGGDKYIRVEA